MTVRQQHFTFLAYVIKIQGICKSLKFLYKVLYLQYLKAKDKHAIKCCSMVYHIYLPKVPQF
jgi:hypothetical protein